jgi:hypothetical protein
MSRSTRFSSSKWIYGKWPTYYEDLAVKEERTENWKDAAEYWRCAAAASIGHNRAERYLRAAESCEEKLNR